MNERSDITSGSRVCGYARDSGGGEQDQSVDQQVKDRMRKGEDHSMSKLTADDVIRIRKIKLNYSHAVRDIAEELGVHTGTVRDAYYRRTWKHLP